jgi:hypothetical protein
MKNKREGREGGREGGKEGRREKREGCGVSIATDLYTLILFFFIDW